LVPSERYKNTKNVTIEMPERLLIGKRISHECKLNKVINNIGYIVEDTKKRYPGEILKQLFKFFSFLFLL
jgi:hypothetical protein